MIHHASKLSAVVLAGTIVAAALPGIARADVSQRDMQFCSAIGLSETNHVACRSELANAMTDSDRKIVQAKFVSLSSLDVGGPHSASLFNPPTDTNRFNGMPGTPYQSKPGFVSNRVATEIREAIYPK